MNERCSAFRSVRRTAGFSLVEIALALGIVGFALVGIIGAIPLAMNSGRQSIAQSRAASVANAMFANFRSQPFGAVQYVDVPVGGTVSADSIINLNAMATDESDTTGAFAKMPLTVYASFDEAVTDAATNDARRLHFSKTASSGALAYRVVLRFNNNPFNTKAGASNPDGTLPPYQVLLNNSIPTGSTVTRAQANSIQASIYERDRPGDVYRFNTVIANRLE